MTDQVTHRPLLHRIRRQIAVLRIPLQQSTPLKKATDPVGNGVGQASELLTAGSLEPLKTSYRMGITNVHPIQYQHMEMNVQIKRRAETLDKGDGTGVGRLVGLPCLLDQVGGNGPIDDTQYLPHDLRSIGKQKT